MKLLLFLIPLLLFAQNLLKDSPSPYLQQHAHNPVNWMPWGEAAFKKAKQEHKPIFVSIGYSTCHWCHVMAKESFEKNATAALINNNYIAIKVDRETLTHVDKYFQQVYLKVKHRSGGWPLSVFLTEDKKTFFIASYLPPHKTYNQEGLDTLLPRFAHEYKSDMKAIQKRVSLIQEQRHISQRGVHRDLNSTKIFETIVSNYDDLFYGFGMAPKFPEASKLLLLFDLAQLGHKKAETMALDMLRAMALRGLYDQVGGGFFRYATDGAWEIPHFEKMLYNQAELIPLYIKAYDVTGESLFKDVVLETIAMTQKRFLYKSCFFSASDADTHHEEGAYFVFSKEEITEAIGNDKALKEALDINEMGNFEGKIHLNFYTDKRPENYNKFRKKLLKIQEKRKYPFIDKKIITSWNMMMISGLFKASSLDNQYILEAKKDLNALMTLMYKNKILYHQTFKDNIPTQVGLLEDYAFSIKALLDAYEVTYEEKYLHIADTLMISAIKQFYKQGTWYLSVTYPIVKTPLRDKYYTSAFAQMMQNLQYLAALKEDLYYQDLATKSLDIRKQEILSDILYAPASTRALLMQDLGVVVLKHREKKLENYRSEIAVINYPYILTKPHKENLFLACKVGKCFAYSKDFLTLKVGIEAILK